MKRLLLIAVFATFPLTLLSCDLWWGNDNGDDPSETGLIAHYPLDGDADETVGSLDGEVFGAQPTEDRFGEEGAALRFDGDNDYVRVLNSEAFNFDLRKKSFSLALWARSSDADGWARLVIKWNELTPTPYPFALQKVGDELWASLYDTSVTSIARSEAPWDGLWHHVAMTYNAETNRLALYLDGDLASSVAGEPFSSTRNDSPVYFGRAAAPVENRYFEGSLDDIRFYDRALSPDDVEQLYEED